MTYKTIEDQNPGIHNNIIMGPWYHHQWARGNGESLGNIEWGSNTTDQFNKLEMAFFNYHLKGEGKDNLPEASVYITGANAWKTFSTWPPPGTEEAQLYLQPGGKLSFSPPVTMDSYDEYVSDPSKPVPYTSDIIFNRTTDYMNGDQRFASRRPDVMVYASEPLKEDITFTGPLQVDLFVTTYRH